MRGNTNEDLPNGWVITKVSAVCTAPQYGYTTKASKEGDLKLLRTTDITSGKIDWSTVPFCKDNPKDPNKYLLKSGDIVISRAGSVGVSYLIENPARSVFASYLIRFCPLIDKRFFYYFLKSPFYWNEISEKKLGIAVPNVNATKIKQIPFFLPPLPEQHRIVAKIEELFTQLDKGIEELQAVKRQLKTYRQAVLKYAFEGKLTEAWRKDNPQPPASELLEQIKEERQRHYEQALEDWKEAVEAWEANGKEGKKPGKPKALKEYPVLTEEELEGFPGSWNYALLGNIVSDIFDGPFGSNLKSSDYKESGVRVIRLENIGHLEFNDEKRSFISMEKYEVLRKHTVKAGDIIFSSFIADHIRTVILPNHINRAISKADCFCIRTTYSLINRNYLTYFLATQTAYSQLLKKVHGATRPRINTTQLKNCIVPICSQDEQTKIVEEIEARLSVCDHVEQTIEATLKTTEALRQSILKKAFEGKLVEQDPSDEPASELLKRINGEVTQKTLFD